MTIRTVIATIFAAIGAIVTVGGGILAILFTLDPGLKPCFGGSSASITATVLPQRHKRQFLMEHGSTPKDAASQPDAIGAEVRYTVTTDGYRGERLPVRYSLFYIKNGSLGPTALGEDRAAGDVITPDACSDKGGGDLFVYIPQHRRRYEILVELFRGRSVSANRIDLTQTEVFGD